MTNLESQQRAAVVAEARPDYPRVLACTRDGVFAWPGIAIVKRRGSDFVRIDDQQIYNILGRLYGSEVIYTPIVPALDQVTALLRQGHVDRAEQYLAAMRLPPISPSGVVLMRAIGRRIGVGVPDMQNTSDGGMASLTPAIAEKIAAVFDTMRDPIRSLEKLFIPGSSPSEADLLKAEWDAAEHPRAGTGLNPGWFATVAHELPAPRQGGGATGLAPIEVSDFSRGFHQVVVDAWMDFFAAKGIPATEQLAIRAIGPDASVVGYPDIIVHQPGHPVEAYEVKTGFDPPFTKAQRQYIPLLQYGGHIYSLNPEISRLGLTPGAPFLPMSVFCIWAPGPGEPYVVFRLPGPFIVH
jgi:hypothetical protein